MPGRLEHHAKNPFSTQSTVEAIYSRGIRQAFNFIENRCLAWRYWFNLEIAVGDICNATLSEGLKKYYIYILFFIVS